MDTISIGAAGLSAASARLAASAQRTVAGGDLAAETVEQIGANASFDASAAVVKTGDDMLKQLLDIKV